MNFTCLNALKSTKILGFNESHVAWMKPQSTLLGFDESHVSWIKP